MNVDISLAVDAEGWPGDAALETLAHRAVDASLTELGLDGNSELSLLFTDDEQIRQLNRDWRNTDKPTNVLSFPAFEVAPGDGLPIMLGDIVLARGTIGSEAALEGKPFEHHLTHLIVHGLLHLLGYDHEADTEAVQMEDLERRILARLAIPDPYR